jgi:hypothetical protein
MFWQNSSQVDPNLDAGISRFALKWLRLPLTLMSVCCRFAHYNERAALRVNDAAVLSCELGNVIDSAHIIMAEAQPQPPNSKPKKAIKRLFITSVVSLLVGLILGLMAGRRMPPSREQVANYLSNMSISEFSEFYKRLTAHWGFQAFPQNLFPGVSGTPHEPNK